MAGNLSFLKRFFVVSVAVLAILLLVFAIIFLFQRKAALPGTSLLETEGGDRMPPITAIVSPQDQSWQASGFLVSFEDVDDDSGLADFIPGKQGCEYRIEDVGKNLAWEGFRECGEAQVFVPVGEGAACSSSFEENSFQGRCLVSSRALDKAGNVSGWESAVFYIDLDPPALSVIDAPEILLPDQEYAFEVTVTDEGKIDGCNLFVDGESTGVFPALSSASCKSGVPCVVSSSVVLKIPEDHTAFFACVDSAGNVGKGKEAQFRVHKNRPPIISSCRVVPTKGSASTAFSFFVDAEDPDGDEISYMWDFGDRSQAIAGNPVYSYVIPGTYMPRVVLTDPEGGQASCNTAWVIVEGL